MLNLEVSSLDISQFSASHERTLQRVDKLIYLFYKWKDVIYFQVPSLLPILDNYWVTTITQPVINVNSTTGEISECAFLLNERSKLTSYFCTQEMCKGVCHNHVSQQKIQFDLGYSIFGEVVLQLALL